MLRIQAHAVVVDALVHHPVVGIAVAIPEQSKNAGHRGVAGGHVFRPDLLHRKVAQLQVLRELVSGEDTPVDVIGIGKDGVEARRLDLRPIVEIAVPSLLQRVERTVLPAQPLAKTRQRRWAKAELRAWNIGDLGPVDYMWLAPQVPAEECLAL